MNSNIDTDDWEIHHPDPQPQPTPNPKKPSTPSGGSLDRLFLHRRGKLSWDQVTGFRGGPQRQGHQLALWSFFAAVMDALLLVAMSCLFLLVFALVVKTSVGQILRGLPAYGIWTLFAGVLVIMSWAYLISTRVLVGFTLGEWVCDLRLGQPSQRRQARYPLKVILRSTLILVFGGIPWSFAYLLTGIDFAGWITGLRIVSLK